MKPKKKVRQGLAIFLVMVLELANCIFEGLYGEYGLVALRCVGFASPKFHKVVYFLWQTFKSTTVALRKDSFFFWIGREDSF